LSKKALQREIFWFNFFINVLAAARFIGRYFVDLTLKRQTKRKLGTQSNRFDG